MKYYFIALATGAVIACSSGQSFANDSSQFGGLYVGAGIGALGVNGTQTDVHTVPSRTDTFDGGTDWGVMGSVAAGFDFQLPQGIIVGVFTDFDFSNAEFDLTAPDGDRNKLAANNAFNVGGRLGFLVTNTTILFADGGYTRGNFEYTYAAGSSEQYTNGKVFNGWFVGAGAEQRINGPWSVKLEYRFAHYNTEQVGNGAPPPPPPPAAPTPAPVPVDQVTHSIDADTHSIRLSVNFDLGVGQ